MSLVVEGVTQVRMLIVFAGQGLFPGPPLGQQLPLLAVPPLHTTVLEPDFYLRYFNLNLNISHIFRDQVIKSMK